MSFESAMILEQEKRDLVKENAELKAKLAIYEAEKSAKKPKSEKKAAE